MEWIWPRGSGTRSRQCWVEFLALTVECQLRLVAKSKKKNTVVTICVVVIITSKEIQEPTVLERTSPAVGVDLAQCRIASEKAADLGSAGKNSSPSLLNTSWGW